MGLLLALPVNAQEIPTEILCSCIKTARYLGVKIPYGTDAKDLDGNSIPIVGGLALTLFKSGNYHVEKITGLAEDGYYFEDGNRVPCEYRKGFRKWTDPALRGFWIPSSKT